MQPITVVICTCNDADGLSSLLDELHNQTWPPTEIVVVDRASADGSAELAISRGITTLRLLEDDLSTAYAVNLGLLHAPTDLVVCISGSAELPDEQWLESIVGRFSVAPISLLFPAFPSEDAQCYAAVRRPLAADHRWQEDESNFDWSMRTADSTCKTSFHLRMNLPGRWVAV